jgi:2-polyprenyl-6-methoxyphenol hydroxylase-like FAD-dependent oxidoreductase
MPEVPLRVLIVGGGVAGLTLAALLGQRGAEPFVAEMTEGYGQAGYLVTLNPLGNRVLRGLGLYGGFEELSDPFRSHVIHDHEGRAIRAADVGASLAPYGEARTLERADLMDLLHSSGGGVPVRTNLTVERVEQDARTPSAPARVAFSDGSEGKFDLVVGADGIRSRVRDLVFGKTEPRRTGFVLYWWWPEAEGLSRGANTDFWGAGRIFGIYPGKRRVSCFAMLPEGEVPPPGSTADSAKGRRNLLEKKFSGFGGQRVALALERLGRVEKIDRLDMTDLKTPHWQEGRVVLVGDAAAAVLPTAGLGASLAMESAAVLADELLRVDAARAVGSAALREAPAGARD